jgi:hypothetical protein
MPGTVRHDHAFTRLDGNEIFVVWDQLHRQKLGKIGDSNCRLFLIDEFLNTLLDAAKANPTRFFNLSQE